METITQSCIGLLAFSTLFGVLLHDTNIDKVAIHVAAHFDGGDSKSMTISSHPHTHSERNGLGAKAQPAIARDPRQNKAHPQTHQVDYFRLPGSSNHDHTLVLA